MSNLKIKIDRINRTDNYRINPGETCETRYETIGELYRGCMKEHGRCIGSIFIDKMNGKVKRVGWVFLKREEYLDCAETFLCETWISVYAEEPRTEVIEVFREL